MVSVTIDTSPVKGYVTIRKSSRTGTVLAQGTAPQTAYSSGQWIYYASFGDVEGYITPPEDGGLLTVDKQYTYVYETIIPPPPPPPTEYTITITSVGGGTTNPAPGTYTHPDGTQLTITAIPLPGGYVFDHWVLNGVSYPENPITLTLTTNTTLNAVFVEEGMPPQPPPNGQPGPSPADIAPYLIVGGVAAIIAVGITYLLWS